MEDMTFTGVFNKSNTMLEASIGPGNVGEGGVDKIFKEDDDLEDADTIAV